MCYYQATQKKLCPLSRRCTASVEVSHKHVGRCSLAYNGSDSASYRGRLFPASGWDSSPESYLLVVFVTATV